MAGAGAAAFVTQHPPNVFYLSGFRGSSGAVLVERQQTTLYTDSRYAIQAAAEATGAEVQIVQGGLLAAAGKALRAKGARRALIEAEHLSLSHKAILAKQAGSRVRWVAATGVVEELRRVKSPAELEAMRRAARLGSGVFQEVLPFLRPGVRENEIAAEIEYRMRRRGASGAAFETIVAFGERSALPHARPTARKLRKNELVVLDWGAILADYCCDLTRTVYVGRASQEIRGWYAAVRRAQQAARDAVREGMAAGRVDAAARDELERAGLGKFFIHSTGHGLGLEVHERPRVARGVRDRLRSGETITIEPGVYREGVGGIRIEDDVVVTSRGSETLTTASREFLEL